MSSAESNSQSWANGLDEHGNLRHCITGNPWIELSAVERSKLIASAPDLLEAAQEALSYLVSIPDAPFDLVREARVHALEQAIAKTKGKTS